MSIRPLEYWYRELPDGSFEPDYGSGKYVTNDLRFLITHRSDGWRVKPQTISPREEALVTPTGIFDATFLRRRDTIVALEAVIEEVGLG